jgi:oligopeptide transport system substrate-binding protein
MRLHLSSRHWLDAYDPSWEAHISRLVDTAASILEKEISPSGDSSQPQALTWKRISVSLPWKLILSLMAVGIVIGSVIGFMKLRGGRVTDETPTLAAADDLPNATEEGTATEETVPLEEVTSVPAVGATESAIEVVLNGYFTTDEFLLDPQRFLNMESYTLTGVLLLNLTNFDFATSEIVPEAAESWTVSPDAKLYTFKIRTDIPWVVHTLNGDTVQVMEDGEPRSVNAHDFVYAIKRVCRPKTDSDLIDAIIKPMIKGCEEVINYEEGDNIPQAMLDNIGVRAISDYELQIELSNPYAFFLSVTSCHGLVALPSWALEDYGDAWTNPGIMPTNGYFVIDQWNSGDSAWLKRNPLLPEDMSGSGNIDTVKFVFLEDIDEAYDLWLMNELDYSKVPTDKILSHRGNFPRETSQLFEQIVRYIEFNMKHKPFDNVHVRRAFAAAFDNASFVNDILQGQGIPMKHIGPPGVIGAPPVDEVGVGYNPQFAQAELAAAGYPNCQGFPQVRLGLFPYGYPLFTESVIRKWEENLNCPQGTIIPSSSLTGELFVDYTPDMLYVGWAADYPDENNWVGTIPSCDNAQTITNRTCNEIDDLIEQASIETNLETRIDLYYQIEEALFGIEGECPMAPVLMEANYYGDHSWLNRTQALPGREEFHNWSIDMEAKLEVTNQ